MARFCSAGVSESKETTKGKSFQCAVLFSCFFVFPSVSVATNHYVWCGATGAGTGADFNNAYRDLPASLLRGDTYYIAGSTACSYGYHAFKDPVNGTSVISIIKATAANSGLVAGWQPGFGSNPAMWLTPAKTPANNLSFWYITSGYYTFDGQYGTGFAGGPDVPGLSSPLSAVGSGNYVSGYGFYLESWNDGLDFIQLDGSSPPETLSGITVSHTEANGICETTNSAIPQCNNAPALVNGASFLFTRGRPSSSGDTVYSDIALQNSYGHDIKNGYMGLNSVNGVLVDHDQFSRAGFTPASHGNGIGIGNSNNSFPILALYEFGNLVIAVLNSVPSNWPIGSPIAVYDVTPTGHTGNFTAFLIGGNTVIYFNPITGLEEVVGQGHMTFGFVQQNITVSNTNWQDVCGTSVITNMNGALTNLLVYGNTFSQTTLTESFDGSTMWRCNGNGQIGDLGNNGFGAIASGVKIYNNTFANASTTGVSGVEYNNSQSTGIDQENNLVWGSQNVRFMNAADNPGNVDSSNTVIDSTLNFAWTGCKNPEITGDYCINTSGVTINSASSRTSNVVDLHVNSGLTYNSGDGLVVIGSNSGGPSFACGLDTVFPFPPATKISSTEATYNLVGPNIAPGTCENGYGDVFDSAGAMMPFVSLVAPFNFELISDTADPHLNDGVNTNSLLPENGIDMNGVVRGANGNWDRGALQSTGALPVSNLKTTAH